MKKIGLVAGFVLIVTGVLWLGLGIRRVPDGAVALVEPLAGQPGIVGPGWRFATFGLSGFQLLDPYVREGDLEYVTPEGAVLDLRIRATLRLSPDGGQALLRELRDEGSQTPATLDRAFDRAVLSRIRELTGDQLPRFDDPTRSRISQMLTAYGEPGEELFLDYREDSPVTLALRQAALRREVEERRQDTDVRVVVIGWDGADWQIAEPLIDRGRMPNLARLRARGAWGNIRSLTPMLSPLLWTSVATGVTADRHGVLDFLIRDRASGELVPVSSRFRRVRALWNLFSDANLTSDVVAWWATWPAEPVRGHLVSDRVAYSLFDFELPTGSSGATHPPSYFDEIRPSLNSDEEVSYEQIARFVDISRDEFGAARKRISEDRTAAYREPVTHLTKILAATDNYQRITLDLLDRGQSDLTLVYYQGIDEVGHRFMHFTPPELPEIRTEDRRRYGRTVEEFYVYQDELLGELLARIDPDSTVILLSDHGFLNGADRPSGQTADIEGQPGRWHRPFGVLVLAGPPIVPVRLDTTSLLDIAPTTLYLAGLPIAEDMAGRILSEAIRPNFRERFPARHVASYEATPFRVPAAPRSDAVAVAEAEIVENLRSLGYVGASQAAELDADSGSQAGGAAGSATLTTHTNLAAVLLSSGDLTGAEQELVAALQIHPDYPVARRQLFTLRVRQARYDEALAVAEQLIADGTELDDRLLARIADTYRSAGKVDAGIRTFSRAVDNGKLVIGSALARLLLDTGDVAQAERIALRVLEAFPRNEAAMVTRFRIAQASGRLEQLRPALEETLRRKPRSVMHLNWMAIVDESAGNVDEAERLLRRALEANPDHGGSMANLGAFYSRHGKAEEAVSLLRRALELDPGNLDARINLGSALARLGRLEEAIGEFEAAVEGGRDRVDLYNAIARAHVELGNTDAATGWLRRSLALEPEQPAVRRALAQLEPR